MLPLACRNWKPTSNLYSDNPLAAALTALMKASRAGRPRQKQVSLQQVAVSDVDEARKFLLTNLIETYLTMNPAEQEQFEQLLAAPRSRGGKTDDQHL